MSSGVDQKRASQSRRIFFRSTGGTYSAMFMSDRGDLYQEYEQQSDGTYRYYPDFSQTGNEVRLRLSVVSSKSTKPVNIKEVRYYANDKLLEFDAAGKCTAVGGLSSPSLTGLFELSGTDLVIKGNIADFAGFASFMFSVEAFMSGTAGSESVTGHLQCTVAAYNPSSPGRFTIMPGDTKNFTISDKGGSCVLQTLLSKDGVDSHPAADWYRLDGTAWTQVATGVSSYTVTEAEIQTYGIFKAVYGDFSDTQGVQDASDPYDISLAISVSPGDGAAAISTNSEELTDEMPDDAYIQYVPSMVVRGDNTAVSGSVTWDTGTIVTATGLILENVPYVPYDASVKGYKVTAGQLRACGGVGEYNFVFSGQLS